MSRPSRIDPKLVSKARALLAKTTSLGEFRAAQAVLLPAIVHTTLEQTASLLGVGRATVARLQQRLRETVGSAVPVRRRWGGRRRALLSFQEEEEFLAPWVKQAAAAGVLVVSPLRAALAEKLGRKVAASVVYRLLARHGWRKLSPDTKHPKSDPLAQAEWKKNSPPCWQICSPPKRSPDATSA
jgi:transposase